MSSSKDTGCAQSYLTKLLFDLWTIEIKIFQCIHHTVIPFTTTPHIGSDKKKQQHDTVINLVAHLCKRKHNQ